MEVRKLNAIKGAETSVISYLVKTFPKSDVNYFIFILLLFHYFFSTVPSAVRRPHPHFTESLWQQRKNIVAWFGCDEIACRNKDGI